MELNNIIGNYQVVNETTQYDIELYAKRIVGMTPRILESDDFIASEKITIIRVGDLLQQVLEDWKRMKAAMEHLSSEPSSDSELTEEQKKFRQDLADAFDKAFATDENWF